MIFARAASPHININKHSHTRMVRWLPAPCPDTRPLLSQISATVAVQSQFSPLVTVHGVATRSSFPTAHMMGRIPTNHLIISPSIHLVQRMSMSVAMSTTVTALTLGRFFASHQHPYSPSPLFEL